MFINSNLLSNPKVMKLQLRQDAQKYENFINNNFLMFATDQIIGNNFIKTDYLICNNYF